MLKHLSVLLFVVLAPISQAVAADLTYIDYEPFTHRKFASGEYLVISGEIVPGDYDRLLKKIYADQDRFLSQNKVVLASDGGDVGEAIRIGKLLRTLFTEVMVGPITGRCVSACFLIYAGANQRKTDDERLIGIHRPYVIDTKLASMSPADAADLEDKILKEARAYLQDVNVPTYLIEEMFRRASNDAYWLTERDVENLGYRAASFDQYLVAKCGWNSDLERQTYRGEKPFADMKEMWACRTRVTLPAAEKALQLAMNEQIDRSMRFATCHQKGTVDPNSDECPDFTRHAKPPH